MKLIRVTISIIRRGSRFLLSLLLPLLRLRDFGSLKFVHIWIYSRVRTLLPGFGPVSGNFPYMPFKAKAWLESYLKPNMSVFEYGSGGSTTFLSRKVHELISIEHDKSWYRRVSSEVSKRGISNCRCLLYEPEKKISVEMSVYSCKSYTSTLGEYVGMSFENYVRSIEKYPDGYFDLVIVDGRARASCLFHALSKIRPGGYLMLDDTDRQRYDEAISLLADYKRTDLFGIAPYTTRFWQTSVWEIKS